MLPREITRGSMRGAPCVCEVVVELYRMKSYEPRKFEKVGNITCPHALFSQAHSQLCTMICNCDRYQVEIISYIVTVYVILHLQIFTTCT